MHSQACFGACMITVRRIGTDKTKQILGPQKLICRKSLVGSAKLCWNELEVRMKFFEYEIFT